MATGFEKQFNDVFEEIFGKRFKAKSACAQEVEDNADFTLPFGTYKGVKLREVPAEFLRDKGLAWPNKLMRGRVEVELLRRVKEKAAKGGAR